MLVNGIERISFAPVYKYIQVWHRNKKYARPFMTTERFKIELSDLKWTEILGEESIWNGIQHQTTDRSA